MFQNLDEYFDANQQTEIMVFYVEFNHQFFRMPLKPDTFRMSLPKVIMIANTFTMSILCVRLKPNAFVVSFPEMIMAANFFTSQKHQISNNKTTKQVVVFKATLETL